MKGDHRSYICNLKAVAKRKPEKKKNIGLYRIPCPVRYRCSPYHLSQQANWEQVVELVRYKPMKG